MRLSNRKSILDQEHEPFMENCECTNKYVDVAIVKHVIRDDVDKENQNSDI